MKPTRTLPAISATALALACLLSLAAWVPACADDVSAEFDRDGAITSADAGFEVGPFPDAAMDVTLDLGAPPMEPRLTVTACSGAGSPAAAGDVDAGDVDAGDVDAGDPTDAGVCCASALGFEDGTTGHFLPPACCRESLSAPVVVASPAACGRGALRLTGDFRTVTADSACGQQDETQDCAYQLGDVSRAVLTSLNLTGTTVSAMVYLDAVTLTPGPQDATLYVLGGRGLLQGAPVSLNQLRTWTPVTLAIPDDGSDPGADVRVIGLQVDFHGQAWRGYVYLDEITWR